jgi:leader peptidase (prepilin peptidase)/N-methyltransferase
MKVSMMMTAIAIDLLFLGILIFGSLYDIRHYVLPNVASLALAGLGLISAFATQSVQPADALIGAILGGGILWIARLVFRYLRHEEGLGLGDVKWMAAGGIWVGWSGIGPALMIATLAGLVAYGVHAVKMRRLDRSLVIPFGPFLSFGIASIHLIRHWH